jgi:hypothetical protein
MNKFLLIYSLVLISNFISAQDATVKAFVPNGDPIVRIFANVHNGLTATDRSKAFEVRRAYLGYKYRLSENFSTEIKLDIGSPEEISEYARLRRYAYFKTAALYWEKEKWTIKGGIIDTEHYRRQEKYWKHRYIYKSLQDEHRFGPKADLGTTVIFAPFKSLAFDASVMNGEGYQNLQNDNAFKYSGAISYFPFNRLLLRVYYDFIDQEIWQSTLSTFAGYRYNKITAGAEFNTKGNRDFQQGHTLTGLSFYLSYDINEKFELFGRFDRLSSNTPPGFIQPWNLVEDGSAIIAGVQFKPIEQVKLALNYQDWVPYASNMGNLSYIFVNVEIDL